MTTKVNLKINQGETYRHTMYLKDSQNQVVDITGHTARMQVRSRVDSADVLLELSTDNSGIIISNPTLGEFKLYISATTTANINWVYGVYDLEMVSPNEDVTRLIEGSVNVIKEVTR